MPLTRFVDSRGQVVVVGRELGVGGQGAVHLVDGRPGEVAKVYLKPPSAADVRKLEAQVQACRPDILSVSAWPSALLKTTSGSVQGLIMPLVDPAHYTEIHNLFGPASRRKHFPKADWAFLIHVARNVARAFAVIHDGTHVVGDVSSRNILVSQQGILKLIDTDSFQVRSGQTVFPCPVGTPDSTPPELQGQAFGTFIRTTNHDLFGMALIIFQLLFQGRHPYSGIHTDGSTPSPAEAIKRNKFAYSENPGLKDVRSPPLTLQLSDLSSEVGSLFERAFASSEGPRPTAKEWDKALAVLAQSLAVCSQDSTHKYVRGKHCPWCKHNLGATLKRGFSPSVKRLNVHQELNRVWQDVQKIPKPAAPQHTWIPAKVAPLSLKYPNIPMLPPLPMPKARLIWAKVRTFIGLMMLCLLAVMIWREINIQLDAVLGALTWLVLATSNSKNILNKHNKNQIKRDREIIEKYEVEKDNLRILLQAYSEEAQKELKGLQDRKQNNSALAKYQAAFQRIEAQRNSILMLATEDASIIEIAQSTHRQIALDAYLKQQILSAGIIPGIGDIAVSNLRKSGVLTAYDVTEKVRTIAGVGPSRATGLLLWRKAYEGFFNFDPNDIPVGKIESALIEHDQKISSSIQALSRDINKTASDVKDWQGIEESINFEIREKLGVIEQCKMSLNHLNELWP